jgi:hypothetical protein
MLLKCLRRNDEVINVMRSVYTRVVPQYRLQSPDESTERVAKPIWYPCKLVHFLMCSVSVHYIIQKH